MSVDGFAEVAGPLRREILAHNNFAWPSSPHFSICRRANGPR
ncbi:hypothetical protein ACIA5C_33845 [Actinoplanes sp. NPDC051343]